MRVVMVSAHYPPNFVSGGTLQPQRLAHGLRARGHEVSVYAGWLGDRPPLSTWEEEDGTGMPIRWITTTPWTGWSDRRNFDNPPVARHFAGYLDDVRPDVVHLHSLQSLGAGLLTVAQAASARVVVTMHDFWWICGRQFLVDRSMQPCSPVIIAGECPCEVTHDWLAYRAQRLHAALRCADVVLAPSHSAARVLVANGIAEDQVRIDENGIAGTVLTPVKHGPGGAALRAVYAGGPSEMKGSQVLMDALQQLRGLDRLRVIAYGLEGHATTAEFDLDGLPLELRPPFDPARLNDVFGEADVLLLPSVMRESHSILTREALSRGVPVVSTDSLGPEEAVEHDRNGLIVPTGDAQALARAVRRLLLEDGLLDQLKGGCARTSPLDLTTQIDRLEQIYRDRTAPVQTTPPCKKVLFIVGIDGAPARYRAHLPAEAMALHGVHSDVRYYRDPEVRRLASEADAVVVYRVPATPQILGLLADLRKAGTLLMFDVDDLIFDPDITSDVPALSQLEGDEAALWLEGVRRYRTTMEACDAFIGSTQRLCEHAEEVAGMPAAHFRNGVGIQLGRYSDRALRTPRTPGPLRIGYFSGTTTHDADWALVEEAVVEVLRAHDGVELWLGGHLRTGAALEGVSKQVRRFPFMHWTELPRTLRDLDVNLAPLAPGLFNEAKSAIKWLEAALVETVTVASPTEPFCDAIGDGRNGVLATDRESWTSGINRLIDDPDLRGRLGRRARRDALLSLSPHVQGRRYLDLLACAYEGPRRDHGTSGWQPVTRSEPWVPSPLEPYDQASPPVAAGQLRRRIQTLRGFASIARVMTREHGYRVTARRAASFARRRALGWTRRSSAR